MSVAELATHAPCPSEADVGPTLFYAQLELPPTKIIQRLRLCSGPMLATRSISGYLFAGSRPFLSVQRGQILSRIRRISAPTG